MSICIEKKLLLSGKTEHYQCELVMLRDGIGILRYVIDRDYDIAGFRLSPGDETLALYWTGRPYTLYVWHRKRQGDRAYYFNIADSVALTPLDFVWRDLAVDILIAPQQKPLVLDEHELPDDLDSSLTVYIGRSKQHILENYQVIMNEAERLLASFAKDDYTGG